jgi:hypothetical protein
MAYKDAVLSHIVKINSQDISYYNSLFKHVNCIDVSEDQQKLKALVLTEMAKWKFSHYDYEQSVVNFLDSCAIEDNQQNINKVCEVFYQIGHELLPLISL